MIDLPPDIVFRPGTVDEAIWREATELNVYRLPDAFAPGDIVLDIGAHTGSVTLACAKRGAKVFAVEASRENFVLLLQHTATVVDAVVPIHAACWRSDQGVSTLRFAKNWQPENTGGGAVMDGGGEYDTLALPLDWLLVLVGRARLVKMDTEGAEFPILYTSQELSRIHEIALEYHERPDRRAEVANVGPPFTAAHLAWHLTAQGFAVEVVPKGPGMGLMFGRR